MYEASFRPVWAYVVSRVGRQAAEEVVSETFAVAWRRRASIPADAVPWLIGVARHVVQEMYRADTRDQLWAGEITGWIPDARGAPANSDVAQTVVDRYQMLSALASLSDADREVLLLVAWHGLSPGRTATALQCSRPAFFVRLHRARRRLERALRERENADIAVTAPAAREEPVQITSIVTTEVSP
jgi:RNA polymerase sigma-70 factor (ECF subfamily)